MPKATKTILISGIVVIALVMGAYLYVFPKSVATGEVPCIDSDLPLTQHVHAKLEIFAGTEQEQLPGNVGRSLSCDRALHTHDDEGDENIIHVESQDRRRYTLGDFFSVWGKPIKREGYDLSVTVDGAPYTEDLSSLELTDGQEIIFTYAIPRK